MNNILNLFKDFGKVQYRVSVKVIKVLSLVGTKNWDKAWHLVAQIYQKPFKGINFGENQITWVFQNFLLSKICTLKVVIIGFFYFDKDSKL